MGAVLPTAYVFPASGVGGPIEPRNLTRAFKAIARRAGLPPTTRLYDLRHACASLLLAAGEHPRVVADLLGHSTTKPTTDTYSHVLPTLARSAAEDALLAGEELPSWLLYYCPYPPVPSYLQYSLQYKRRGGDHRRRHIEAAGTTRRCAVVQVRCMRAERG